jgi:hypothetical protein
VSGLIVCTREELLKRRRRVDGLCDQRASCIDVERIVKCGQMCRAARKCKWCLKVRGDATRLGVRNAC